MVDGLFTMHRALFVLGAALLFMLTTCSMPEGLYAASAEAVAPVQQTVTPRAKPPETPGEPEEAEEELAAATMPPVIGDILDDGTLIVISKGSQNMHVFRNGELWDTTPVSTGKRGKETPTGVFPILQKKVFHRSNLYSNAPMPHMQRLTWDGIALHAGYVPGYPASHGCIRMPPGFAKALFGQTSYEKTAVVVVNQSVGSKEHAMEVALRMPIPIARNDGSGGLIQKDEPQLARLPEPSPEEQGEDATPVRLAENGDVIQLAAAPTAAGAEAHWSGLLRQHPELEELKNAVIPATVNGQKVYRLQAAGKEARASCDAVRQAGGACFPVG